MGSFRALVRCGSACVATAIVVAACSGAGQRSGPSINDEVHDGNFAFTVKSISLGVPETGHHTAQGAFVVINLMVRNIGGVARSVYCQNQVLRDPTGRGYENGVSLREEQILVEPGKQVHVACAFDAPTGMLPTGIVLRDSQFSRGVMVRLLS